MPSVHGTSGPYRFFFFSFDCAEPKHVHAERDGHLCKSWLQPIALASNSGFRRHELNEIRQLSARHAPLILQAWEQHCGRADDT